MANVMDLGFAAKTGTLYAGSQILCPNFTQPDIQVASGTTTVAWVTGFQKYVFYIPLTTATAINSTLTITGLPINITDLYSVDVINVASFSSTITTAPVYTLTRTITGNGAAGGTLSIVATSSTSPVFSSGTGYIKIVATFNLE